MRKRLSRKEILKRVRDEYNVLNMTKDELHIFVLSKTQDKEFSNDRNNCSNYIRNYARLGLEMLLEESEGSLWKL